MKPQSFVEMITGSVQRISRQIRKNNQSLDEVRSLDRKLAKLTYMRERLLGQLAHAFLKSEVSVSAPSEFEWIVTEIKAIEQARQDPTSDSLTSLATLVVPSAASEGNRAQRDMELITSEERTELYRRRLRGLYLDLAEMLLAHQLVREFPEARERVLSAQRELESVRMQREVAYAMLPSSVGVLYWLKNLLLIILFLVVVWIWI